MSSRFNNLATRAAQGLVSVLPSWMTQDPRFGNPDYSTQLTGEDLREIESQKLLHEIGSYLGKIAIRPPSNEQ